MSIFILKRKRYNDPNSTTPPPPTTTPNTNPSTLNKVKTGAANMIKDMGSKGQLAAGLATSAVDEVKQNLVDRPLQSIAEEASTYQPTVKNAYLSDKSYSIGQAVKEIGAGLGKGIWNYTKKNKKELGGMALLGGTLAAGSYGMNRLQRQRAEIEAGEREANGMSTGGKVIAGATALGTGAYLAHKTGKSHDKEVADFTKSISEDKASAARNRAEGFGKRAAQLESRAAKTAKELNKTNKRRLGGLVSNRTFKMGRNALIGGGIMAGAGLLANSMLKDKANSETDQKSYSFAGVGRLAKITLGKGLKNRPKTVGGLLVENIKQGNWGNIGRAAGVYAKKGGEELVNVASNLGTLGKDGAKGLVKDVTKSLESQGQYGKKAADFINRHKTASGAVGAATVGTAGFGLSNAVGEKSVNALTKLDKKTNKFIKDQQAQYGGAV